MQETPPSTIREPSQFAWFVSLGLFTISLLACLGLYVYQYMSISRIERLQTEIGEIDAAITTAAKDRDIIIADILASSSIRPSIDLKALVRSFRLAATQAGVRFQGFSVKDDTISSTLIATRDTSGTDPVETIIDMMKNGNPNTGLSLVPIHSLVGSVNERTTNVAFHILPTNIDPNAIK